MKWKFYIGCFFLSQNLHSIIVKKFFLIKQYRSEWNRYDPLHQFEVQTTVISLSFSHKHSHPLCTYKQETQCLFTEASSPSSHLSKNPGLIQAASKQDTVTSEKPTDFWLIFSSCCPPGCLWEWWCAALEYPHSWQSSQGPCILPQQCAHSPDTQGTKYGHSGRDERLKPKTYSIEEFLIWGPQIISL